MNQRRRRVRASDIARHRKPSWFNLVLLSIALVLVIAFKANMGESTADFIQNLTVDPSTELPPSAPPASAKIEGATSAPAPSAPSPSAPNPSAPNPGAPNPSASTP
ncbi:MAG: hypothetical protein ACE366_06785 [Bradymonadia bacterium]